MSEQPIDDEMACERETSAPLTQAELHSLYLEQQRRMQCHGCGEAIEVY
ncbi:hypothetical protein Pr1d_32310 [Bythopirellula goksoeyrii]|uniref:Uncharacterized protein n=1 Tax=Bythopirellula goksoeyrii TaxID=1400387 RepID=A0A5B9QPM2_9BACT|nr:hypothetical protein Pr1d_32310 [Bythopirellula goksoeyrii]